MMNLLCAALLLLQSSTQDARRLLSFESVTTPSGQHLTLDDYDNVVSVNGEFGTDVWQKMNGAMLMHQNGQYLYAADEDDPDGEVKRLRGYDEFKRGCPNDKIYYLKLRGYNTDHEAWNWVRYANDVLYILTGNYMGYAGGPALKSFVIIRSAEWTPKNGKMYGFEDERSKDEYIRIFDEEMKRTNDA